MEGITLVRTKRHEACAHAPAVQILSHIDTRVRQFLGIHIIAERGTCFPAATQSYRSRETQVVAELHLVVVAFLIPLRTCTIAQTVRHAQAPRNLSKQIAVIGCRIFSFLFLLSRRIFFWHNNLARQRVNRWFCHHFFLLLLILVFGIPVKPAFHHIVVEGVAEAGAGTQEMWETPMIPVQFIASHVLTAGGGGVHIGVKLTAQVDGIVHFRNLDTQIHREVLPVHRIGNEVISATDAQIINDAIHLVWLLARGILVVAQLHLQVIAQRERQTGSATPTWCLPKSGVVHFFKDRQTILIQLRNQVTRRVTRGHHAVIRAIETAITLSPHRVAEVGVITETQRRRHHMAEAVHLVAKQFAIRNVEAIQLGTHAHTGIEVIHVIEAHHRIFLHGHVILVPTLIHTLEEHAVVEAQAGRDTDVLKQHERCRAAQLVLQTILPILHEVRFQEVVFLTRD